MAKSKRDALVRQHLENISSKLIAEHPDVIKNFVGRNAGIYALYRRDRLYYVGLATGLAGRLKTHLHDRHKGRWDRFSIFLTIKDSHIKEIEALLLRISLPKGNRVRGNVKSSTNMLPHIRREVREKLNGQLASLLGSKKAAKKTPAASAEDKAAQKFFPRGATLRGTNKGVPYRARLMKNGKVRMGGKVYTSLSKAASAAIERPVNGWWFWMVERGRGNWTRLIEIRRAGTPLL